MLPDRVPSRLDRREALRRLGAGVGLALAGGSFADGVVEIQRNPPAGDGIPSGAIIRTILADLAPATIAGVTLVHEHLGDGRLPAGRGQGPTPTQDPAWMAAELRDAATADVQCIVAAQPGLPTADTVAYLAELSRRSGVHIVAAGGLLTLQTYPTSIRSGSEEDVAAALIDAAAKGRFGAFAEIGVSNAAAAMAPEEGKVFRALGRAQARTGLPVLTHTNYSTGPHVSADIGLRQLDLLQAGGARPDRCAIGHVCCLADPAAAIARQIAARGAYVAFDRLSRQEQWVDDEQRIRVIVQLLEAGHGDRLLFSSDYGGAVNAATGERNSYTGPIHARDGGPGYARMLRLFLPKLRRAGVDDTTIRNITQDNPRRFLAFVPPRA